MDTKVYIVGITIARLKLTYEVDHNLGDLKDYTQLETNVLPKELRQKLEAFDQKVIEDFRDSSLCTAWEFAEGKGIDDFYDYFNDKIPEVIMLPEQYETFKKRVEHEYQEKYAQVKDEVLLQYDQSVQSFKKLIQEVFTGNNQAILNEIPSKQEYENSFGLEVGKLNWDAKQEERVFNHLQRYYRQV